MNFIPVIKLVVGAASSFGAGNVVGNIIKGTTPDNLKLGSKILVAVGGLVLSFAAGDLASQYVESQIDEVDGMVKWAKKKAKQAKFAEQPAEEPTPGTPEYFEAQGYEQPSYPPAGAELMPDPDEDHQDL